MKNAPKLTLRGAFKETPTMIQCDWISGAIVSTLPLGYTSGQIISLDPTGALIRQKNAPYLVEDPSHSDKIRVFTPFENQLWLSGNPVKLFQGHNLWGSGDVMGLFFDAGLWVRQRAGLFPSPETFQANFDIVPHLSRVDLTRSYRFPSHKEAQEFIRYRAGLSRSRHGAARLYGSETAYFGQKSTRWTLKVYDKYAEFLRHGVKSLYSTRDHRLMPSARELTDWVSGVVRFELTLRTPELRLLPNDFFCSASQSDLLAIWQSYFDRISWTENASMINNDISLEKLPPKLLPVMDAWRNGRDLRSCYPQNTFYRYRKQILEAIGVDIRLPPPSPDDDFPSELKSALTPEGWDPEPSCSVYAPSSLTDSYLENYKMHKRVTDALAKNQRKPSYITDALCSHIKH